MAPAARASSIGPRSMSTTSPTRPRSIGFPLSPLSESFFANQAVPPQIAQSDGLLSCCLISVNSEPQISPARMLATISSVRSSV